MARRRKRRSMRRLNGFGAVSMGTGAGIAIAAVAAFWLLGKKGGGKPQGWTSGTKMPDFTGKAPPIVTGGATRPGREMGMSMSMNGLMGWL